MNPLKLIIAAIIFAVYFPCVAKLVVLLKELGIIDMMKSVAIMIVTAVVVGFTIRTILFGFYIFLEKVIKNNFAVIKTLLKSYQLQKPVVC